MFSLRCASFGSDFGIARWSVVDVISIGSVSSVNLFSASLFLSARFVVRVLGRHMCCSALGRDFKVKTCECARMIHCWEAGAAFVSASSNRLNSRLVSQESLSWQPCGLRGSCDVIRASVWEIRLIGRSFEPHKSYSLE